MFKYLSGLGLQWQMVSGNLGSPKLLKANGASSCQRRVELGLGLPVPGKLKFQGTVRRCYCKYGRPAEAAGLFSCGQKHE